MDLIFRIPKPIPAPETPGTEGVPDSEEELYQAVIFLQKIVKGRAIQSLMCKGRRKCQQLIEEMKSTTALQREDIQHITQDREHLLDLQRNQILSRREEDRISDVFEYLQGHTISFMLDFLSKELWRLQDERRVHAFAWLAERIRSRREAMEAGRRQKEERRRREHDEMFRQIVKVHQDTVDMYLEDLILESTDWSAKEGARNEVQLLAQRIDKAAEEFHIRQDDLEKEELVADLIHNFVVPEVQKQIIRKQIKQRQMKFLKEAHASIYEHIDVLPPVEHVTAQQIKKGAESVQDEDSAVEAELIVQQQTISIKENEGKEEEKDEGEIEVEAPEEHAGGEILQEYDNQKEEILSIHCMEDIEETVPTQSTEDVEETVTATDELESESNVEDKDVSSDSGSDESEIDIKTDQPSLSDEDEEGQLPEKRDLRRRISFKETYREDSEEDVYSEKHEPKRKISFRETDYDSKTQSLKPKLGFKDIQDDESVEVSDESSDLKTKHKIVFDEKPIDGSEKKKKSRPRIGFKEPDIDDEGSHKSEKPKISFKD